MPSLFKGPRCSSGRGARVLGFGNSRGVAQPTTQPRRVCEMGGGGRVKLGEVPALPVLPSAGGYRTPPRAALWCCPCQLFTARGSTAARASDTRATQLTRCRRALRWGGPAARGWRAREQRQGRFTGNFRVKRLGGPVLFPTQGLVSGNGLAHSEVASLDVHSRAAPATYIVTIPWMAAAVSHRERAVCVSTAKTRSSRSRKIQKVRNGRPFLALWRQRQGTSRCRRAELRSSIANYSGLPPGSPYSWMTKRYICRTCLSTFYG